MMKKNAGWFLVGVLGMVTTLQGYDLGAYQRIRNEIQRDAQGTFERLMENQKKNPKDPEGFLNLGRAFSIIGQTDKSAEMYRKVLELDPGNVIAYNNLAQLFEDSNPEYAANMASIGASLDPNYPLIHDTLGGCYLSLKRFDLAAQAFEKSMQVRPDHPFGFLNACNAYYHLHNFEKAIVCGEKAVSLGGPPAAFHNLALAYEAVGRFAEAAENFQKALDLYPGFSAARHGLDRMQEKMQKQ